MTESKTDLSPKDLRAGLEALAKNSPDGRITFKTALQYGYTYGEMHRLGWIAENDWSGYRRKRENE